MEAIKRCLDAETVLSDSSGRGSLASLEDTQLRLAILTGSPGGTGAWIFNESKQQQRKLLTRQITDQLSKIRNKNFVEKN